MNILRWLRPGTHNREQINWERTVPPVTFDANNRRRLTDVPYLLPKDDQEIQRLDYQHYILRSLLKSNCFAPIDPLLMKGANVLDVGSGSGIWGTEIANTYKQSQVFSFDVEQIKKSSKLPQNYQFHKGNLLDGMSFASHVKALKDAGLYKEAAMVAEFDDLWT